MSRRRGRGRRGRPAGLLWAAGALVFVLGFVAGYGWHGFRPAPPVTARRAVEAVVGRLDPRGTQIRVADAGEARAVVSRLRQVLDPRAGSLGVPAEAPGRLTVTLTLGETAYPLVFRWTRPPESRPLLAIVIDDMGRDVERARAFLELPFPVALSVLPHLRHSREVAALAARTGAVLLLHLPMEPRSYPETDPGPGALLRGMGEAEVRRTVREDLAQVPGVMGVNNHMGSRLTELPEPMAWVMDELKRRNLFFLDSLTTARSVAARAAQRAGIPWLRRAVFLDNERNPDAIGSQLRRAVRRAQRTGHAVAIGHPYRVTLETLRAWAPRFEQAGIRVVPLTDLLAGRGGVRSGSAGPSRRTPPPRTPGSRPPASTRRAEARP